MTLPITFFVAGDPKPQPRPRAGTFQGKSRIYDPRTAEGWKHRIASDAMKFRPSEPLTGPLAVYILFCFKRPQALMRKKDPIDRIRHTKKPDIDNLVKAVLDELTQLGFWRDDNQICQITGTKWYIMKEGEDIPGAMIIIHEPHLPAVMHPEQLGRAQIVNEIMGGKRP